MLELRQRPFEHRFVIVAGKGGVGKSTVAMALALAAARSGRRTLLYQYGVHGHFVRTPLSDNAVGEHVVQLEHNLFAVRPSTESGMREYVLLRLRSERAYRLVFENQVVQKLLAGIPGVNELIWLGKAFNHERERRDDGGPVWDTIVLDPPATGHSLYLFQIPFVVREAVKTGPFHDEANAMVSLLQDTDRTAMHLVTLPEEMPVNETIDLRREIDARMRIPIASLVVNAVFPQLFDPTDVEALHELRAVVPESGDILDRLVAAGLFRLERRRLQQRYLDRLERELDLPTVELPRYFVAAVDRDVLTDMASRLNDTVHTSAPTDAAIRRP